MTLPFARRRQYRMRSLRDQNARCPNCRAWWTGLFGNRWFCAMCGYEWKEVDDLEDEDDG